MFLFCSREELSGKCNGVIIMSSNEELRIEARKKASIAAKKFGWKIGGKEYQDEFDDILNELIMEKIRREKENKERA